VRYFNEPEIIPAIHPDLPGHGVPSDHCGVVATPNTTQSHPTRGDKKKKTIRPIPESLLQTFETKLASENVSALCDLPVDEMVQTFQSVVNSHFCSTFPEKQIIVSPEDKPWFTEELRNLKRCRLRE
jgi:hypothetical protein